MVLFAVLLVLLLVAMFAVMFSISNKSSTHHEEKVHEHQHQIDLSKAAVVLESMPFDERVILTQFVLALLSVKSLLGRYIPDVLHPEYHNFRETIMPLVIPLDGHPRYHSIEHVRELNDNQLKAVYRTLAENPEFLATCAHWSHFMNNYLAFPPLAEVTLPVDRKIIQEVVQNLMDINPGLHTGHRLIHQLEQRLAHRQ